MNQFGKILDLQGQIRFMAQGFDRLTERQKDCLRLKYGQHETKEIAAKLSISPDMVTQHLKRARQHLGVNRSSEAARLFAEHEGLTPSHPVVSPPTELHEAPEIGNLASSAIELDETIYVQEALAPYSAQQPTEQRSFGWPVPTARRPTNTLSRIEMLGWALLIAFMAVSLLGAMRGLLH